MQGAIDALESQVGIEDSFSNFRKGELHILVEKGKALSEEAAGKALEERTKLRLRGMTQIEVSWEEFRASGK